MRLQFEPGILQAPNAESFNDDPQAAAAQLLHDGIKAAQAGNRVSARVLLTQAAELDGGSETAWMWLASISEYPEELLAFLDKALAINPVNERALEWRTATRSLLAKTFVQRGIDAANETRTADAIQCFHQAVEHDRLNHTALLWLSSLSESDERKVEFLEKVLDIDPENQDAKSQMSAIQGRSAEKLLVDARSAAILGQREEALTLVNSVLEDSPDLEEAWILKSHLTDDFYQKIVVFERILEINPNNFAARSGLDSLMAIVETVTPNAEEPAPVSEPVDVSSNGFHVAVDHDLSSISLDSTETPEAAADDTALDIEPTDGSNYVHVPDEIFTSSWPDTILENTPEDASAYAHEDPTPAADEHVYVGALVAEVVDDSATVSPTDEPSVSMSEFFSPTEAETGYSPWDATVSLSDSVACPFCKEQNPSHAYQCSSCRAVLSLSDLEMLLANNSADVDTLRKSVERSEAEMRLRELSVQELTELALAHFNLNNYQHGFVLLQEASLLSPNDVVLAGQVNSLAIRLEEIREQEESASSAPRGKKILVVDDSATVRKLISGKLEKSGHEVVCAEDGEQAVAMIKSMVPDLVLLDIEMPKMDGYQVCKMIRSNEATREVPVVMISGKDGFFDKVRGKMAGTTDYITKPFGPEALMKTLDMYLANGYKHQ